MTTTDEDPILKQTVETLQNLQDTLNQPPAQLANRAFSDYIFTELNNIDDEEIIADAKHEINNILYKGKKEFIAKRKAGIIVDNTYM
jgi:hypothetical protein